MKSDHQMCVLPILDVNNSLSTPNIKPGTYIRTSDSENLIHKKATIHGSQNIVLGGNCVIDAECVIRGDLRRTKSSKKVPQIVVSIGKNCLLSKGCLIKPGMKISTVRKPEAEVTNSESRSISSYMPIKIHSFVFIQPNCTIQSSSIGDFVLVGQNSVLGEFSVIGSFVIIEPGSFIPPYTVLPDGSYWSSSPSPNQQLLIDHFPAESSSFTLKDILKLHINATHEIIARQNKH